MNIPVQLSGTYYTSTVTMKCNRFHKCKVSHKCQNYSRHNLMCHNCELKNETVTQGLNSNSLYKLGGKIFDGRFQEDIQEVINKLEETKGVSLFSLNSEGQSLSEMGSTAHEQDYELQEMVDIISKQGKFVEEDGTVFKAWNE